MRQFHNIVFISTVVLIFLMTQFAGRIFSELPYIAYGKTDGSEEGTTVIFTGDIMLAREVERIMNRTSPRYPFSGVENLLVHADVVVGNFEGSVPQEHVETPDFGFQFSVRDEFLPVLREVGFDILSLANNHTFDFGNDGYVNTQEQCVDALLICVGKPTHLGQFSTSTFRSGEDTVGLFALEAVRNLPNIEDVVKIVEELKSRTDMQIAYVHWGTEYEKEHSEAQEQLAHALIDAGIDVVVGHHPHVVQDIEIYRDRAIFYSLGNFVFDQYFDQDVQEGLMVQLEIKDQSISFTLIPVSSMSTPSQPQIMGLDQKDAFITDLLSRSSVGEHLVRGHIITLPRYMSGLASNEITSTMSPQ